MGNRMSADSGASPGQRQVQTGIADQTAKQQRQQDRRAAVAG